MKAISLWQPYASLLLTPHKIHETRHWPTKIRGPVLTHAAKKIVTHVDDRVDFLCRATFGADWRNTLPRGALIGEVEIIDCRRTEDIVSTADDYACGGFEPGRFGWRRGDQYNVFKRPIPFKGKQGFFNVPDELIASML